MSKKEKGMGDGEARQLNAGEKVKVILWINSHEQECRTLTAETLAAKCGADCGLVVSESTILTYRREVFTDIPRCQTRNRGTGGKLMHEIKIINERLAGIEKRLTEAGA
jgi:hypothetical protein